MVLDNTKAWMSKKTPTNIVMKAISLAKSTAKANKAAKKGRQSQTKMPAEEYIDDVANLQAAAKFPSKYNVDTIFGDNNACFFTEQSSISKNLVKNLNP